MTEVNLSGNAKQHLGACAIDPKLSSDIEAHLKIPKPGHYIPVPGEWMTPFFRIFPEFRAHAGLDIRMQMAKAGIPNESIKDY